MDNLIKQLLFSASVTGPICLMLLLGILFKRFQIINDAFIDIASKLVFQVCLPIMLFFSIINSDSDITQSRSLIIYGLVASFLFYLFTTVTTKLFFKNPKDQGVIIQGAFRSNTGIIALAYVTNVYGNDGMAMAAMYVASTTFLYNVQAVITLSPPSNDGLLSTCKIIFKTLTKNPLIIAILLGVVFYILTIPVPKLFNDTGRYFSTMTLPLALLCSGGSLDIRSLQQNPYPTGFATVYRLVLCPLLLTVGAYFCGFKGMELGIIFFMSAAPTAAASYVMARTMGGNATLAANIIAATAVFSLPASTLGIFILATLGVM